MALSFAAAAESTGQKQRESPKVSTENGVVRGKLVEASEERVVAAFLGVPYARPPIGDLRFRPPQDVLDWREGEELLDATVAPASCVQRKDYFFADFAGATVDAPRDDVRDLLWHAAMRSSIYVLNWNICG